MLVVVVAAVGVYAGLVLWSGLKTNLLFLKTIEWEAIALALSFIGGGFVLRFLRWHWYLRTVGVSVSGADSFSIFMLGFAMTATPGKVGEAIKAVMLKRRFGVPMARSGAVVFMERVVDLMAVCLVLVGGGVLVPLESSVGVGWVIAALTALTLLAFRTHRRVLRLLSTWTLGRPRLHTGVQQLVALARQARSLLQPRIMGGALLMTALAWCLEGLAFHMILQGAGVSVVPSSQAVLTHLTALLVGVASFLPGGLGSHEAVSVLLLTGQGVSRPDAVAATLLMRILTLWLAVGLGLVFWLRENTLIAPADWQPASLDDDKPFPKPDGR